MGVEETTSDKHKDGASQRIPVHPNEVFFFLSFWVHFFFQ